MKAHHFEHLLLWCLIIFLAGCAANEYYLEGRNYMAKAEYDAAIKSFELALEKNPDDPKILREIGIVYYHKADYKKAIPILLNAFLSDSTDGRTIFYLGITYEMIKDIPRALDIYRRYVDVKPRQEIREKIEARLVGLARKEMESEAKTVLAKERAINITAIPDSAVAVLYFKNIGKNRDLDPIQKGLADMLITDLSKVKKLQVVERVRMQKMLDEIGLGLTGLVDSGIAPRVGKLLGASKLVNGTYINLSKEGVRIDAGFILVKKEKPFQPSKVQGKMAKFFQLEKDLVFGIIDRMGIQLTQDEKDKIKIIPTENLLAFMAYCRGLDYEDKGMFKKAAQEYKKAVELDPKFKQADQAATRIEDLTIAQIDIRSLEAIYAEATGETVTASASTKITGKPTDDEKKSTQTTDKSTASIKRTPPPRNRNAAQVEAYGASTETVSPTVDQMMHTSSVLDQGFLPGIDSRKPTEEQSQSSFGNTANFEIRVPLPQE